ncbi:MAG: nucleotide sugar dehydrogenase [Candidatus Eisenbacteria bacterium]|nr:nucleotide sugar dehydrogenase [Candidatus Eisenbacteria bacterium]
MLRDKLLSKEARLGVIGLGYVGLPLAMEFERAGFHVTGIDNDGAKIDALRAGESYIQDVPDDWVGRAVREGTFEPTGDFSSLKEIDSVDICVPTPLRKTKDPDISFVRSAVVEIEKELHPDMLIILDSTTYPGTTDEVILSRLQRTGLKAGRDFYLAFSPERVDPGNPEWNTKNIPKVVGGVTPACTEHAVLLYEQTLGPVVPVSSTKVAETVKLLENTFRSVNIGLVNEMALMCDRMGIDVWEVIDAAATKPFGFMPFYPGPGLGGHCIPIDPFYLSWKAKETGFEARFIELAGQINSSMPYHVVGKVTDCLNDQSKPVRGSRVLLLGVAYKEAIDDVRESPAIDVLKLLLERGAEIVYSDPHVPRLNEAGLDMESVELTSAELARADCVVITTAHPSVDYRALVETGVPIVDTRNALKGLDGPNIRKI